MATTPLEFRYTEGLASDMTAILTQADDTDVSASLGAISENTNGKGRYQLNYTGATTGHHVLSIQINGTAVATYDFVLADNTTLHFPVPAAGLSVTATGRVAIGSIDSGALTADAIAANAITAAKIAADAITAAKIAVDAIGASELATDAVNEIRDAILSDSVAFAGADIDAAVSSRATPAQVKTQADTALTDIGLDHLVSAAVVGADVADNSVVAQLVSSSATADWDDFANTDDSLQAIRDRGDSAWVTGSGTGLTALASGTAQGGTADTIQLAAAEVFADDELNGNVVAIVAGTGAGQSRLITDYTGSTDTATVAPDWTTTPDNTSDYEVVSSGHPWNATTRTLTQSAAQIQAIVDGSTITALRGDTLSIALTGLGDISDRSKLWFTAKRRRTTDAQADVQVEETDGLVRIGGSSPEGGETASIVVDDAANGDITITISAGASALLDVHNGEGEYDVQVLRSSNNVDTLTSGEWNVTADVSRVTA